MATISRTAISSRTTRPAATLAVALGIAAAITVDAHAFSQITREDGTIVRPGDIISHPLPPLDPDRSGMSPDWGQGPSQPATQGPPSDPSEGTAVEGEPASGEPLAVRYGDDGLPGTVRDLRARLIEIAEAGEIEALRPYLEGGFEPTALSVTPIEGDPIEFLKAASGDGEGVEILAILLDVLRSGHVRVDAGSDAEIFVWPYFTQVALDELTNRQLVELFQIVTAGDYREMLDLGAYYFYRVGISPEGRLEFFLAGD